MGYISGKNYGGDFGAYDRAHYGKSASKGAAKNMAGYSFYSDDNPDQELSTRQVANLAQRDSKVLPAGLQGLNTEEVSKLAIRDSRVLPAGLQGLPGDMNAMQSIKILDKTVTRLPGMLSGLSTEAASKLAVRDMNVPPAGGSLSGFGEDKLNAFEGLGDGPKLNNPVIKPKAVVNSEGWSTNFSKAASALTETGVISGLAAAVKSVPDNTPAEVKQQYYKLAVEMLKKKRLTDVRHLDLKRVELESNLGWLVDPSLPKTGGFDKAISRAMGVIGNDLSHNEKYYAKTKRLEAMGTLLKKNVEKLATFAGLGQESDSNTKLLVGLGIAVGVFCWYKHKKK